ncbi:MAG: hypothetical protein ACJAWV_003929, partial [Flammeovirgaceae bacterium]
QKAVWINSIKSVFDYNSKEALSFITELPCVKLSEANKLEELKYYLAKKGIELNMKRTINT